jgi:predicted membrane protein
MENRDNQYEQELKTGRPSMNPCKSGTDGRYNPALVTGVLAIVIGGLVLLDHMGFLHVGNIWRFWPLILIIFGVNGLLQRGGCRSGKIFGAGMMTIWGSLLLVANFGYIGWNQMWPIALIAIGLLLVWESFRPKPAALPLSSGALHPDAVFSSIEKTITDQDFTQGSASAIFGSVELDFIQANMTGDSAVLELNAVFGSIEIRVPLNWNVVIEAGAVFGSCENRTRAPLPGGAPMKNLYIRGGCVFGSVEVKN